MLLKKNIKMQARSLEKTWAHNPLCLYYSRCRFFYPLSLDIKIYRFILFDWPFTKRMIYSRQHTQMTTNNIFNSRSYNTGTYKYFNSLSFGWVLYLWLSDSAAAAIRKQTGLNFAVNMHMLIFDLLNTRLHKPDCKIIHAKVVQ